jgi:hypothetical protein
MEGVATDFGGVGGAKPYLARVKKRDHGKKIHRGTCKVQRGRDHNTWGNIPYIGGD